MGCSSHGQNTTWLQWLFLAEAHWCACFLWNTGDEPWKRPSSSPGARQAWLSSLLSPVPPGFFGSWGSGLPHLPCAAKHRHTCSKLNLLLRLIKLIKCKHMRLNALLGDTFRAYASKHIFNFMPLVKCWFCFIYFCAWWEGKVLFIFRQLSL